MTTPPTTLHDRLRAELDRRLAVAHNALNGGWESLARWPPPIAAYLDLHDPADAIRRYLGELEVRERHAPGYPGGQVDYDTQVVVDHDFTFTGSAIKDIPLEGGS